MGSLLPKLDWLRVNSGSCLETSVVASIFYALLAQGIGELCCDQIEFEDIIAMSSPPSSEVAGEVECSFYFRKAKLAKSTSAIDAFNLCSSPVFLFSSSCQYLSLIYRSTPTQPNCETSLLDQDVSTPSSTMRNQHMQWRLTLRSTRRLPDPLNVAQQLGNHFRRPTTSIQSST